MASTASHHHDPRTRGVALGSRRKDSLKSNAEIKCQIGLHVVVWQAAPRRQNISDIHLRCGWTRVIKEQRASSTGRLSPRTIYRAKRIAIRRISHPHGMLVDWHLRLEQGHKFDATCLPQIVKRQSWPLSRMHRIAAFQIRKGEG